MRVEAKEAFLTLIVQSMRLSVQALVLIGAARLLGATEYGFFAAVVSLAAIFVPIAGLGADFQSLIKVARDPNSARSVFLIAIRRVISSGILLTLGATVIAIAIFPPAVSLLMVVFVLVADVILSRVNELAAKIHQGRREFGLMGLVRFLTSLFRLLAVAALWLSALQVGAFQWASAYVIASALAALVAVWLLLRTVPLVMGPRDDTSLLVKEGMHFAGGVAAVRLYAEADKTLVLALSDATSAGVYSAASRMVDMAVLPAFAWVTVIAANQFKSLDQGGVITVIRGAGKSLVPMTILGCLIGLIVWWFIAPLSKLLLGESFTAVAAGAIPLALRPLAMGLRMLGEQTLAAINKLGVRSVIQWSVALSAVIANWWLIPLYGWIAAAWVCVCAELCSAAFFGLALLHSKGHVQK